MFKGKKHLYAEIRILQSHLNIETANGTIARTQRDTLMRRNKQLEDERDHAVKTAQHWYARYQAKLHEEGDV